MHEITYSKEVRPASKKEWLPARLVFPFHIV